MRITDMMVGDWVQWGESYSNMNGDYDVYWEDKQLSLNDFATMMEEDWDDIIVDEFVSPIPLTAEILEKNGFKQRNEYYHITIENKDTRYCVEYDIESRKLTVNNVWFVVNEVRFVHELQHALKQCKIDKEIVL